MPYRIGMERRMLEDITKAIKHKIALELTPLTPTKQKLLKGVKVDLYRLKNVKPFRKHQGAEQDEPQARNDSLYELGNLVTKDLPVFEGHDLDVSNGKDTLMPATGDAIGFQVKNLSDKEIYVAVIGFSGSGCREVYHPPNSVGDAELMAPKTIIRGSFPYRLYIPTKAQQIGHKEKFYCGWFVVYATTSPASYQHLLEGVSIKLPDVSNEITRGPDFDWTMELFPFLSACIPEMRGGQTMSSDSEWAVIQRQYIIRDKNHPM